jgi:hypothetical protein
MKKPEVYLDMDGVLADFFTEYAKLAGIESGNYRDIPPAKTDPTLQKMVGTDFFARLPKLRNADQLVSMIVKLYGHYHICSSPLRGDHENSEAQKKVWIQKHLNPQPKDIVITPNKAKWAKQADGTPNILIDDRGSNISAWEAAGGIGIKYQADEDGLDVIVNGLTRARKIMKGEEEHKPQDLKSVDRSSGKLIAKSGDNDDEKLTPADSVKNEATRYTGNGIHPKLVDVLKQRGYKGPYQLGKLKKWFVHLKDDVGAQATDEIMVTGNDVEYDEWVLKEQYGEYAFGSEGGYMTGDANKVIKNTAPIAESASAGATGSGSIASSSAQGGGWLFGGTVGAPKGAKKKKPKVIKR